MRNFDYVVAGRIEDAFGSDGTTTMPIAGGTELLNWFRLGIAAPERIVDLARIDGLDGIERTGDRLSIGALATLNQIGENALVAEHATALGDACLKAASAQVRNRATIGGNVLQKTRCAYFRAEAPLPWGCNKRAARLGLCRRATGSTTGMPSWAGPTIASPCSRRIPWSRWQHSTRRSNCWVRMADARCRWRSCT